jgi:hypothetical protein
MNITPGQGFCTISGVETESGLCSQRMVVLSRWEPRCIQGSAAGHASPADRSVPSGRAVHDRSRLVVLTQVHKDSTSTEGLSAGPGPGPGQDGRVKCRQGGLGNFVMTELHLADSSGGRRFKNRTPASGEDLVLPHDMEESSLREGAATGLATCRETRAIHLRPSWSSAPHAGGICP